MKLTKTPSQGAHLRRAKSLGLRVRSSQRAEICQLRRRYAARTPFLRILQLAHESTGWVSVLGWQTGLASLAFLAGTMIQGLLVLNYADYSFQQWHGTLLVIAITAFCIIFNTVLAKRLPMVEGIVLIIHILGFFAVLIPLWVLAPRGAPKEVFTEFLNLGGWSTTGLAFMVGLLSPIYTLIGADSAVHMSEEIKDASIVLPKAIIWAALINGSLGWVMIISFCFTLGSVFD